MKPNIMCGSHIKSKKKKKIIFGLLKLTVVGACCVPDTEFTSLGLELCLFHPTQYFFLLKKQSLDKVQLRQQKYVYMFFWLYQGAVN